MILFPAQPRGGLRVDVKIGIERDVHRVREDVVRGYVSPDAAREDYGVAVDSNLGIDSQATARLRRKKNRR